MAWNKHEWTPKGILFHFVSIPFFKLKSPNVNLFSCLVCLSDKIADLPLCLARLPANQTPGEWSIKHFLKKFEWFVRYTCVQNRKTHSKKCHKWICILLHPFFFIYTYNLFSLWYNFKQFLHYNATYMQLKLTKVHSITFSCIRIHLFSLIPPSYSKLCNFRYVLNSKWVSSFGHSVCMNAANSSVA